MMYSKACAICGEIWHPKDFKQSVDRKSCSPECSSVARSNGMKRLWQRPEYRAVQAPKLKIASAIGREAVLSRPRKASNFPARKTPEGRYYRKLRHLLGARSAREAFGIDQ